LSYADEEIPVISDRTYTAGHMQLRVSGFFNIDASPALDTKASITSDGYTWIQFGASGEEPPNATVTVGEGDKVTGYNPADGSMGDVKIELDFEATS